MLDPRSSHILHTYPRARYDDVSRPDDFPRSDASIFFETTTAATTTVTAADNEKSSIQEHGPDAEQALKTQPEDQSKDAEIAFLIARLETQRKDSEIELLKAQLDFQRSLNATREQGGMQANGQTSRSSAQKRISRDAKVQQFKDASPKGGEGKSTWRQILKTWMTSARIFWRTTQISGDALFFSDIW
jgi:hypothetical protein